MPRIQGITIRRYRALHEVTLGKTFEQQSPEELTDLVAVIGPNGSGKSTLMDALGFLGDCLRLGVEQACEQPHRGGFERLRTKGELGPIEFEIYYRQEPSARPISYSLAINVDLKGRPTAVRETLRQGRAGQTVGQPYRFLDLTDGMGWAWAGETATEDKKAPKQPVKLDDPRRLGIVTLGNLAEHPRIVAFREFLEGWYLSYFVPDLARTLPMAGAQKHLDREGRNLANYVQHMERERPDRFKKVLTRIAKRIPGVRNIRTARSTDGRLLIQFDDRGYQDPFYAQDMSDGTLKLFAYLLLLEDPEPAPLIGIEEPENGLYHALLPTLADEMRNASETLRGPQIFVTTHSPYFVDALLPEQVWILQKNNSGASTVLRAADQRAVRDLVKEGLPLGGLWYSGDLDLANP
ncbi:MAG: AAA family ATPase [Planctomycetota bacterium]